MRARLTLSKLLVVLLFTLLPLRVAFGLRYAVMLRLVGRTMIRSPPKALGIHVVISPDAMSAFSPASINPVWDSPLSVHTVELPWRCVRGTPSMHRNACDINASISIDATGADSRQPESTAPSPFVCQDGVDSR